MAENGSFQVVYGSTLKAWNPRFYTFMMAGKVSKSADNYAQQVNCAKQTSSKICVVCTCLSQFDFCKPVLPCLECTPLLQTVLYFFLCSMSQQVHLIPALRKGDPADNVSSFGKWRTARWRCSWSASSWTLMLWLARQSHEIRDDYVQLQRFRVCLPLPIVALLKQEFFDVVKATQALWSAGEECQEISFGIIYVSLTYET